MAAGLYAILFALIAGLATSIGGLLALLVKKPSNKFLAASLGFSAGVMIYISFAELLQTGITSIGFIYANLAFFIGILIMFIIDVMIPHEYMAEHAGGQKNLAKTGLLVALGIAIHNFPEGFVVFAGTVHNLKLGIAIAFAIALHNIPEGLAVSIPIYAATKSRKKAFLWSFASGMVEPVGAIIAVLLLSPFLSPPVVGILMAFVAGIMVFISIDELVPVSHSYGEEHLSILGFVAGMMIMAGSLFLISLI